MPDYAKIKEDMQQIRNRNNELWMQITQLAMEKGGIQAKHVMENIHLVDIKISNVLREILISKTVVQVHILLDKLENVRVQNNTNWMSLLRIAFVIAPQETQDILRKIANYDLQVNDLTAKLSKEEEDNG